MEKQTVKHFIKRVIKRLPFQVIFNLLGSRYVRYRNIKNIKNEFSYFKSVSNPTRFAIMWEDRYLFLNDKASTVSFDRHYIFHTAWAARVLARTLPEEHIDISSSLYFVSIVSAFIPVRFFEYRPIDLNLTGLQCEAADLVALPFVDASIPSLSCMHVIEHVGLGRYGDPLDPDGDLKAIAELKRVLAKGGDLLFVVPIGQPKVAFNAHRIYSHDQIMRYFKEFKLMEFALIPDSPKAGELIEQATQEMADAQTCGCGCFWFKR